jgi:hypothetical protein
MRSQGESGTLSSCSSLGLKPGSLPGLKARARAAFGRGDVGEPSQALPLRISESHTYCEVAVAIFTSVPSSFPSLRGRQCLTVSDGLLGSVSKKKREKKRKRDKRLAEEREHEHSDSVLAAERAKGAQEERDRLSKKVKRAVLKSDKDKEAANDNKAEKRKRR